MNQKLTINISGNITVELESPNIRELVEKAAFWSGLPTACPLCKAPVVFFYRNPKDNDYYGLRCTGPRPHETNFGIFKDAAKGFYYKGTSSWKESQVHWDTDVSGEEAAPQQQGGSAGRPYTPNVPSTATASGAGDLVTGKQLGAIRAIAKRAGVSEYTECMALFNCQPEDLNIQAASEFIKYLENLQKQMASGAAGMTRPATPQQTNAGNYPQPSAGAHHPGQEPRNPTESIPAPGGAGSNPAPATNPQYDDDIPF